MTNLRSGPSNSDRAGRSDWKEELAQELRDALAKGSEIDYEQWRADLDATIDPRPKDWYEWAAHTDRHVDRRRLEEI